METIEITTMQAAAAALGTIAAALLAALAALIRRLPNIVDERIEDAATEREQRLRIELANANVALKEKEAQIARMRDDADSRVYASESLNTVVRMAEKAVSHDELLMRMIESNTNCIDIITQTNDKLSQTIDLMLTLERNNANDTYNASRRSDRAISRTSSGIVRQPNR